MDEDFDVVGCPECGGPAEIVDRMVLASTSGPVDHVKVRCLHRHWFLLPVDQCPGWDAAAVARPTPAQDRGF
ncbi:hypothetical protein [Pseudonocardia sp. GCM10023141]|uniref:hypothetical protein n=1 Tax=Pseudonocardia sp. GCM10023141 TaxID=3252653 RepID=UPI00360BE3CD